MVRPWLNARQAREEAKEVALWIVTDCKCAFDHLDNISGGVTKDRRTAIDMAILKEELDESKAMVRWIDGKRHQVTDPLTKKNGNADLLRAILSRGEFVLTEESEVLKIKERERESRLLLRSMGKRISSAPEPSET